MAPPSHYHKWPLSLFDKTSDLYSIHIHILKTLIFTLQLLVLRVRVITVADGQLIADFPRPKTSGLQFSPKGTYLVTWEPYAVTKDTPQNTPNLHIWKLETKESVKSYVQKKHKGWEPAWSCDEKLLARNLNQELQVYETDKMESIANKMQDVKVADFSLSPGHAPYFFLCYIQGMSYLHKLFYQILISFQFQEQKDSLHLQSCSDIHN